MFGLRLHAPAGNHHAGFGQKGQDNQKKTFHNHSYFYYKIFFGDILSMANIAYVLRKTTNPGLLTPTLKQLSSLDAGYRDSASSTAA